MILELKTKNLVQENKLAFKDYLIYLRHADDTTLTAESEEELKSLLMKEESEMLAQNSTLRKLRSWHLVPSLHGK